MSLLAVTNLTTTFRTSRGPLVAVNDVSFVIEAGEIVGLVGESGSGKSAASRSIIGLIPQPPGQVSGSIRLSGNELVGRSQRELQRVRGEQVAMIFQDPMTSLNPVYTVGEQVAEALRFHKRLGRAAAMAHVAELFRRVGIAEPEARLRAFPHQLSGGMRQRVMLAIAIACQPALLIADEPTTALDVTIQAQILDLLRDLNRERGMAVLLITHDLGVVAEACQRVMVMYAGRIVEQATTARLFPAGGATAGARHPYTRGLLSSMPDSGRRQGRLLPIPGSPPDLVRPPVGCAFAPRCPLARERCRAEIPALRELTPGHLSACHFAEDL
jgi:oligopeptide/dipeptide ABC transporter ATP-binding protein